MMKQPQGDVLRIEARDDDVRLHVEFDQAATGERDLAVPAAALLEFVAGSEVGRGR